MSAHIQGLHGADIPDHARGFFDPDKTREWMKEKAINGFHEWLNKVETPDFKLRVKDLAFEDPSKRFTLQQQKQAVLDRHDLTLPLKGTAELIDKRTGHVVETKKVTLAHVPWLTDRNTVIYGGSEYGTTNQQRLKPGIYTRIKDTGDVEAHVNVKAGTGSGGKVIFFPDKALFIYQVGTTRIKLYGLLRDLGVSDAEMEAAWGHEIFIKNKTNGADEGAEKMYDKIFTY